VSKRVDPACPKRGGFWFSLYGVAFYIALAAGLVYLLTSK
jgi:hypothetical protein